MDKLAKIKKVVEDIKSITIQWATNIAKAAIEVLGQEMKKQKFNSLSELKIFLAKASMLLRNARATEPMLFNGLKFASKTFEMESLPRNCGGKKQKDVFGIQSAIVSACEKYVSGIEKEEEIRPAIGAKIIKKGWNIVTHCHSWSVVKTLVEAHKQGKNIHVYNTETRPLYQWRRTSADLVKAGVPDTMIVDDAAPFFIDNLYESHVHVNMVIMGCDNVKLDGSIYNKIGSFAIALAARHSKIPVYVVGSLTKVDMEKKVEIEKRSGKEVRSEAPKWLEIVNYAFDMVPAKFITGIITEFGIIKPKDLKKAVKKYYPRMAK